MNDHANQVEVDRDAELALIQSIGAQAGQAEAEAEHAAAGHDAAAWKAFGDGAADVIAGVVCPNWGLDADDRAQLSQSIAGVMDHFFPGAIAGADNWHPVVQLAFVFGTMTATRGFDWSTLSIKPLRQRNDDDEGAHGDGESDGRLASISGGDESERENGPGFSFGGS